MEACWPPRSSKNRCYLPEALKKKKPNFSLGKTMILRDPGVQVESQNGSKIDPKTKLGWEGLLASIFFGFWWILGPKMGPSWHPKLIKNRSQKGLKKGMPKSSPLGGILEASWDPKIHHMHRRRCTGTPVAGTQRPLRRVIRKD